MVCGVGGELKIIKEDNQYCIIFNSKNEKKEIKLQTGTEKMAKQWIKEIHSLQESLRNAIIKGADIESDKLRVSDDVQWKSKSKKSIPSEIAQFLSEEQIHELGNISSPRCLSSFPPFPPFPPLSPLSLSLPSFPPLSLLFPSPCPLSLSLPLSFPSLLYFAFPLYSIVSPSFQYFPCLRYIYIARPSLLPLD